MFLFRDCVRSLLGISVFRNYTFVRNFKITWDQQKVGQPALSSCQVLNNMCRVVYEIQLLNALKHWMGY